MTTPNVNLVMRAARPDDAGAIARLATELGYPSSEQEMRARIERLLQSDAYFLVVAEQGSEMIGWIAAERRLLLESGERAEIVGLIVTQSARRAGTGQALVTAAEEWARRQGLPRMAVRSSVARAESHPFYERLGYVRAKTQHAYLKALTGLALCVVTACGTPDADHETPKAPASAPRRLRPSAFTTITEPIQQNLAQRGCSVPQTYADSLPHNVVSGRFTSPEQLDVAVLCLRDTTSVILVYRAGLIDSVSEVASRPHLRAELSDTGAGFTFSRALGIADSAFIQSRFEAYGGTRPPPLDHHGLNDIFPGKGSVVWYWHRGRWLQLQGSD
jgi:predicted N-acetyltransferase YhbS